MKEQVSVGRWAPKELARGVDRYRRYLALFGLDENSFAGQAVCHIGCGPFGGVLAILRDVAQAYRVDVDAAQCQRLGKCADPLLPISSRTWYSPVPGGSCDAVFCLGATGETTRWYVLEREIRRICKIGGRVYLWWRPSDDYWKQSSGRVGAKWRKTGGLTVDRMREVFRRNHWIWVQEDSGVDLPNLYPAVEAWWAVLERGAC